MATNTKYTMTRKEFMKANKKKSAFAENMSILFKDKLAMVGLAIFAVILFCAIFADVIVDYQTIITLNPADRLLKPCAEHPFGTDEMGRDIFFRVIHGARISLKIGVSAVVLSMIAGGIIGSISGYVGGRLDYIVMRFMDIFMCLPSMLLAIAIVAAFSAGEVQLLIAIAISQTPQCARVFRASIMSVKDFEYVEAARALGVSTPKIILKHILVNAIGPIIVHATMAVGECITLISSLSFLGLGIAPPAPEWGTMLSGSRAYMRDYPHLVLAPGMAILLSVFAFNLLGDGLRDAMDPRIRK